MYISWLRSSKIHTSSNSCVRFHESSGGFQSCVWRKGQSENKNHQHPLQCSCHTCKRKKTPGILKKSTLHDHPQPRTSEVAVNTGFCFTSRSTSTRSALTPGSSGFANRWKWWWDIWMVFWYIQELHVFLLITIPCSLVPLPNYIWQESKKGWMLHKVDDIYWVVLGTVLGGMERFGAILDSRDDILESFAIGALDASHVHVWLFDGSLSVGSKSLGFPK